VSIWKVLIRVLMGAKTTLPETLKNTQPGFKITIDRDEDRVKYVIHDSIKNYKNVFYVYKRNFYEKNKSDDGILRELCIDYCMRFGLISLLYGG